MKPLHLVCLPTVLLALAGCQAQTPTPIAEPNSQPVVAGDAAPAAVITAARPGPAATWNGNVEACRTAATPNPASCLIGLMRRDKADAEALAISQRLVDEDNPGFISAWQEHNGIGVATLEFPFRANTNTGTWLVDSQGQIIDVDEDVLPEQAKQQPALQAFFDANPESWPVAPAQAGTNTPLPDGGTRLVYLSPMRECRACETSGELQRGYDFDKQRRFIGAQVLGIEPTDTSGTR